MERLPLDTEALAGVGYDGGRRGLEVEFTSGGVYRYFDVPPHEVEALLRAGSRGAYFTRRVRDRYRFESLR